MEATACEKLCAFCNGEVFDVFAIDSSKLPFESGEDILEHVKRVKTEEFKALVANAMREIETMKTIAPFANLCGRIEERRDPDSVISFAELMGKVVELVGRPFITSGTIGDDVHKEPCWFIGSKESVARFRTTQNAPEFR